MDITQLKYFLAVAEEKSYNKASKRLYLSRQALRSSVRALEEEIGAPLFLLQNNRLVLTVEGERLLHDAREVVRAFDDLVERNSGENSNQKLRINVDETMFPFMAEIIMPCLNVFLYDHPEIDGEIFEFPEKTILNNLSNKICDVAVIVLPHFDYDFLRQYTIFDAVPGKPAVYTVRTEQNKHLREYPYSLLADETIRFPGPGDSLQQKAIFDYLERIGVHVGGLRLDKNVEELAGTVRSGQGISFCTYPGCKRMTHSSSTIHIPMEDSPIGFHLVILLPEVENNKALQLLRKYLKQEFPHTIPLKHGLIHAPNDPDYARLYPGLFDCERDRVL